MTGTVIASPRDLTAGQVLFDRLIANSGVRSIVLNGFNLSANVTPAVEQTPGIFLYGGVQTLKFNDIDAIIDTSVSTNPPQYQIVIGDPSTPLKVKPSIYLDSIINSVFDSTSTTIPTGPITTPSVLFSINGVVQNFERRFHDTVAHPAQLHCPVTKRDRQGMDRRAAIRSDSGWLPVRVQRGGDDRSDVAPGSRDQPPQCRRQGDQLHGSARHDALRVEPERSEVHPAGDVRRYRRCRRAGCQRADRQAHLQAWAGRPDRRNERQRDRYSYSNTDAQPTPTTTVYLPATSYGVPLGSEGYPAHGLLGGVITAKKIKSLKVGPANYTTLTAQNPNFVMTGSTRTATSYMVNPGTALTNAAITTQGSIGHVTVTGNQLNSEIKTGFDYQSYLAGLEGTREASRIARLTQRGDLVSSVDSATFRPAKNTGDVYSTTTGTAGKGSITGTSTAGLGHGIDAASYSKVTIAGSAYNTGGRTALGNYGAGFFARRIKGKLPKSNG